MCGFEVKTNRLVLCYNVLVDGQLVVAYRVAVEIDDYQQQEVIADLVSAVHEQHGSRGIRRKGRRIQERPRHSLAVEPVQVHISARINAGEVEAKAAERKVLANGSETLGQAARRDAGLQRKDASFHAVPWA